MKYSGAAFVVLAILINVISALEEGDVRYGTMVLTREQIELRNYSGPELAGTGKIDERWRWPKVDGKVIVPYYIRYKRYSRSELIGIRKGMRQISDRSCVIFRRKRSTDRNYIKIIRGSGCYSSVGNLKRGSQDLSLGERCATPGTVSHELFHALGFEHMQCSYNRDNYITVNYDNIDPSNAYNYDKVNNIDYSDFNTWYDFNSIMHYRRNDFAKAPGLDAMVPKPRFMQFIDSMGNQEDLSPGDITRLNTMYHCLVNGRQF